jgi:hypothetical protein
MFIAPKGKVLLQFDLSQAETWVVAHLANEHSMIHALNNLDIHSYTCSQLFDMEYDNVKKDSDERYLSKRSNHGLSYRMSAERFCQIINKDAAKTGIIVTLPEVRVLHKKWHNLYNIKQWWREIESELSNGRCLSTPYGRKRTFFQQWGEELFKEATAYVPQSTVGDHALGAIQPELGIEGGFLGIAKRFKGTDIIPIHTAHDSVMLEVPSNCLAEVASIAYGLFKRPLIVNHKEFTIPVDAEVGDRWGELEKYKVAA